MQHALDAHRVLGYAEENNIMAQGRHAQSGGQVLAADIAQRGKADALALGDQLTNDASCIGPAAFGEVVADVEEVLPRLRRKRDLRHQVERLRLFLVAGLTADSGSA